MATRGWKEGRIRTDIIPVEKKSVGRTVLELKIGRCWQRSRSPPCSSELMVVITGPVTEIKVKFLHEALKML